MGLPVLRLPHVVFDNIYQSLDVLEIIFLSKCSRRVQDLVRSLGGPRTGRQVSIDFYSEYTSVQVVQRINDFCYLLFSLRIHSSVRNHELTDEKIVFHLNVDGTTWDVRKCQQSIHEDWYCFSEEGCYEKDVLTIVKMLRNLLNCSISDINYRLTSANFQKLFVETDTLHRADQINISGDEYDPKDITFMFDHFVTDDLNFSGNFGPEYSYQKPLNFPKVELAHAAWVNLEKVFEMTRISKHVELRGTILIDDRDINQFIKLWLTSDNNTLKFLSLARGQYSVLPQPLDPDVVMNKSVIMEGIESTAGKKKRNEATKYLSHINWQHGLDIVRKDGVRATILLGRQTSFDEFLFAVWYHPNPDVEEVTDN